MQDIRSDFFVKFNNMYQLLKANKNEFLTGNAHNHVLQVGVGFFIFNFFLHFI